MSDMQRETLFRSATFQLRDDGHGGMPTLSINFARFNEFTEIRDIFEGHFMERFAPGSFKKTIQERGDKIKVLFQHGQDPQVGNKPLGSITDIREENDGAWADVKLLDTDYVRELVPGIKAGLYGASMAFRPLRTEEVDDPGVSDDNPAGLREVTVKEASLREFGPVTFPAYESTSVGVRSLTGDLIMQRIAQDQDAVRQVLAQAPDIVGAVTAAVNGSLGASIGLERALLKTNTPVSAEPAETEETSTETTETEEQAPAEATPAVRMVRVGDHYLPLRAA